MDIPSRRDLHNMDEIEEDEPLEIEEEIHREPAAKKKG